MKKVLSIFVAVFFVFGFLGGAFAVSENATNSQERNKIAETTDDVTSDDEDVDDKVNEAKPSYNPRSDKAREHMSDVAQAVEELVRSADRMEDPGIGDQVKEIAKAQGESEDRANEALDRVEGRGVLLKFFFGPGYKDLKEIKKEIQENKVRINELNRLMQKTENEDDVQALVGQIELLEEQNTDLSNNLEEQTQGFSLLGWLFKIINNY